MQPGAALVRDWSTIPSTTSHHLPRDPFNLPIGFLTYMYNIFVEIRNLISPKNIFSLGHYPFKGQSFFQPPSPPPSPLLLVNLKLFFLIYNMYKICNILFVHISVTQSICPLNNFLIWCVFPNVKIESDVKPITQDWHERL